MNDVNMDNEIALPTSSRLRHLLRVHWNQVYKDDAHAPSAAQRRAACTVVNTRAAEIATSYGVNWRQGRFPTVTIAQGARRVFVVVGAVGIRAYLDEQQATAYHEGRFFAVGQDFAAPALSFNVVTGVLYGHVLRGADGHPDAEQPDLVVYRDPVTTLVDMVLGMIAQRV